MRKLSEQEIEVLESYIERGEALCLSESYSLHMYSSIWLVDCVKYSLTEAIGVEGSIEVFEIE